MSSTNGKFTLPSIKESLSAIKRQNSQQTKIKRFLLNHTNITMTQRRAVVQLIQYYKEANSNEEAQKCTQMENQASTTHNEQKCSELTNTHGGCEIVTKNPIRKEINKKNDIQLMTPIITEITTKKLITEVIPQESKDSSTQTLESVENLNKHEELEEEVKYLNNIIQDQVHQIRYLKENLATAKKEMEAKVSETSEMIIDYNKLIRKDYETSDSNLMELEGKINTLEHQLETSIRSTTKLQRRNSEQQVGLKVWQEKHASLDQMITDKESQEIAKESMRVIRHQVFISLKAKHIKERSLFTKENKRQEYEKVLSLFSDPQLQDKIIIKAAILNNIKTNGVALNIGDPRIDCHLPVMTFINKSKDILHQDLNVFSLL